MENSDWIKRELEAHAIPFEAHTHPAAHTMQDCLALPFLEADTVYCKNVALCNRQQTEYYLMLLRPGTAFRTAVVSKQLGVSRLSFAPESALPELLRVQPGSVSPLGLFFDIDRRVRFCYESALRGYARYAFHPCDNTQTLIFTQDMFWNRLLPLLSHNPVAVTLDDA